MNIIKKIKKNKANIITGIIFTGLTLLAGYKIIDATIENEKSKHPNEFFLNTHKLTNGRYYIGGYQPENKKYQNSIRELYFNLDSDSSTIEQYVKLKFEKENNEWITTENKLLPSFKPRYFDETNLTPMSSNEQIEINTKFQKELKIFSPSKIWW
jgi:hypothetical protein